MRNVARGSYVIVAVIIAILLGDGQPKAELTSARQVGNGAPFRDNNKVATGPDGRVFRFVRWAIGSRDDIVTLRIPVGFTSAVMGIGCHAFGPSYTDPNCLQPYATTLLLRVMLPDFTPVPTRMLASDETSRVARISVESILSGKPNRTPASALASVARIKLGSLVAGPMSRLFSLTIKPSRFELQRVGPEPRWPAPEMTTVKDFYYSARGHVPVDVESCPEHQVTADELLLSSKVRICQEYLDAADFAFCTVEEVPDRRADPGFRGVPLCEQWFAAPEHSAIVAITYERQHLENWREIKRRTLSLLAELREPLGGERQ